MLTWMSTFLAGFPYLIVLSVACAPRVLVPFGYKERLSLNIHEHLERRDKCYLTISEHTLQLVNSVTKRIF
ncbi:hypothetical protein skT53_28790 [Effusibacillus dendaii]|uniref:Uncharacterized protein n=1 Tax=Effusibacillus dendaii TaxID=2743772 RepID=A0A7I8DCS1_9BACL|nr:hypothetical protein skT53_28790 [Effusibacillus dendaii]